MNHLFLTLMLSISALIFIPFHSAAQDIPDNGGQEIEIDITNNSPDTGPRRAPTIVPFTAFYYASQCCVALFFQYNIGEISITLTNLTTGNIISTNVNSQCGFITIPLYSDPGTWQIMVLVEGGGPTYSGFFVV